MWFLLSVILVVVAILIDVATFKQRFENKALPISAWPYLIIGFLIVFQGMAHHHSVLNNQTEFNAPQHFSLMISLFLILVFIFGEMFFSFGLAVIGAVSAISASISFSGHAPIFCGILQLSGVHTPILEFGCAVIAIVGGVEKAVDLL